MAKTNIPPVPKYAEEQNLGWVRCNNTQGQIVAVVEDMIEWMVVFDRNNPQDHHSQHRDDWQLRLPDGGTAWGSILVSTLDVLIEQSNKGIEVGVWFDENTRTLMFAMDSDWVQSVTKLQQDIYKPTIH